MPINMDQQGMYTMAEFLDLSNNSEDSDCDSSNWLSSTLDSQKVKTTENQTRSKECHYKTVVEVPMSEEELKIRSELGMKIERDLEEELKEGINQLALRLLKIFQQRKERDNAKEVCDNKNRALSEVNICIKMEGETKIELKEVKKEAGAGTCKAKKYVKKVKKFDWEKSLRTGLSPACVNRSSYVVSSKHMDRKMLRGKNASAEKKLFHLGWKV